mmetsp:Transcript_3115/g.4020  ORF Transcript_3115/g.4020 Transcript_3115/m.4020 type:complete len:115 (+) Transcript_3115:36-380(+)
MDELPSGWTADPQEEAKRVEQEEQKKTILKQMLTTEALERLGRVKLVRQEKAQVLEMKLIQMALKGELQKQVTEDQLIFMLEKSTNEQANKKITYKRRGVVDDDDDDDNDDDLF